MAGDAVIGALRVVLGMDTGSYEDDIKKAGKATEELAKDISKAAVGVTIAFSALVTSVVVGVERTVNEMSNLVKASQRLGVSVEQLSGLKLAADLSGVSTTQLAEAFSKLAKNATEAAGKPMSQAANAFRTIGVNVTDSSGKIKSQGD